MSDLLSRQEVIAVLNERARNMFTLDTGYSFYLGALHDVADDLRQMPTIDAVPVKRGVWEYIGGYGYQYRCSKCVMCAERKTRYCPNCGAKMDGGKDDGT